MHIAVEKPEDAVKAAPAKAPAEAPAEALTVDVAETCGGEARELASTNHKNISLLSTG